MYGTLTIMEIQARRGGGGRAVYITHFIIQSLGQIVFVESDTFGSIGNIFKI